MLVTGAGAGPSFTAKELTDHCGRTSSSITHCEPDGGHSSRMQNPSKFRFYYPVSDKNKFLIFFLIISVALLRTGLMNISCYKTELHDKNFLFTLRLTIGQFEPGFVVRNCSNAASEINGRSSRRHPDLDSCSCDYLWMIAVYYFISPRNLEFSEKCLASNSHSRIITRTMNIWHYEKLN